MNIFPGKCFCITGATGRLGCAAVERLEELGAEVIPLVLDNYPDKPKRIKWNAETEPVIIRNFRELNKLKEPQYVVNFHWNTDRTLSYLQQLSYETEKNLSELYYFWNWLSGKKLKRFVNISSIKVFSHLNDNPVSNVTEPRPFFPYGLAKLAGEKFFDAYFDDSDFSVVHLRLGPVASYGEHPTHLISRLYRSAFKGERILVNKGHTVHLFYIDEVIDLIISAAVNAEKSRYLLVKEGHSIEKVARKFEEISGKKINAEYKDLAPGQADPLFLSDNMVLNAEWVRKINLEETVRKIIKFNEDKGPGSS